MNDLERILFAKNRIVNQSFGLGRTNPISLSTDSSHIYRVIGMSQVEDILDCGYVRPPLGKAKGGHSGEVFWSQGGEKLFFYDKRPVLEISCDKLKDDGQIGSISLDMLTGIWIFDEEQNKYVNKIQEIRKQYNERHPEEEQIQRLKILIAAYEEQINKQIRDVQPYMHEPTINDGITKIIIKNNMINASQIIDSLNDYKNVAEIKQAMLYCLIQINDFARTANFTRQETSQEQTVEAAPSV